GADANPYLVASWVLGGVLRGLTAQQEPPDPLQGNLYRDDNPSGEALPCYWPSALERFEASDFARELMGAQMQRLYAQVKRKELEDFSRIVTPAEIACLLPAV